MEDTTSHTATAPGPFQHRLAHLRFDHGLSQEALARELGVTAKTIQRIESGATPLPRAELAKQIADYFGTTPSAIFLPAPETGAAA